MTVLHGLAMGLKQSRVLFARPVISVAMSDAIGTVRVKSNRRNRIFAVSWIPRLKQVFSREAHIGWKRRGPVPSQCGSARRDASWRASISSSFGEEEQSYQEK